MNKRYDVMSPRKRKDQEKPYWHRVGTAWDGDKGIGITFDSLPLPDENGEVRVKLFEPRQKDSIFKKEEPLATDKKSKEEYYDDEIPFK